MHTRVAAILIVAGTLVTMMACGSNDDERADPIAIRLVDQFDAATVEGAPATPPSLPRTEWRFDGQAGPAGTRGAGTPGWAAGAGVAGLAVREGLLVGRTTDDAPLLHVQRTSGLESHDQLHAIEVRLRASAGANVSVQTSAGASVEFRQVADGARRNPWVMSSPLQAGTALNTYVFLPNQPIPASRIRHVMVRPTDVAGAEFAVESVRLVWRAEHLASVPSGIGWQGLKEIYRESLVARAPETLRFALRLPDRAWFDLAVGTIEEHPVTFRVTATPTEGSAPADSAVQLDYTVTTPYRWETHPIDLSSLAGRAVSLELSIVSEKESAVGFWGSPVVRSSVSPRRSASVRDTGAPPQGVILIQADTLRRDHLDVYGYERTTAPAISRMAAQGVLFERAIAQAAWTKASSPSLLTSLYPSTVGVVHLNDRVPASATTLAEVYRAAGYATLSLSSVAFTGQLSNLHQGFEELHESASLGPPDTPYRIKNAREYVDRTLAWLHRHRDVPFFVFLHVMDPHSPYEPYPPYNALWSDSSKKHEHEERVRAVRPHIAHPTFRARGLPLRDEVVKAGLEPDAFIAQEIDWYDGSIRAMDVEIGRLFERLAGLGLDEQTLVVLVSDHGEEFFDHGGTFHEHSVYGELTNVPLIVRWPGRVPAGRRVDEVVQLIDVMPTVLALSRVPAPEGLQGQSLLPLLRPDPKALPPGERWAPRPAIAEAESIQPNPDPARAFSTRAIIDDRWKLVQKTIRPPGAPEYELYEHRVDPLDTRDVAGEHPDVVARLARALEGWRQMAAAARLKQDTEATSSLSADELQRLRSLGYIR